MKSLSTSQDGRTMLRLEFERRRRKLTQLELANLADTHQPVIAMLERQVRLSLDDDTRKAIAHVLEVPPSILLREITIVPEPEEVAQ